MSTNMEEVYAEAKNRQKRFLQKAFELMDLDRGGGISTEELGTLASLSGLKLTQQEMEDIVHEHDSDASGQLELGEFTDLVLSHAKKPEAELRDTWDYFDANSDGVITMDELKAGLEKAGLRLAPWELREMMQVADENDDQEITFEEFKHAYGTLPWIRAQGITTLMEQIVQAWKLLDADGNGHVDVEELTMALSPLGASQKDIEDMIRVVDVDGDNQVSFKEFLRAYHSNQWLKVRLVGVASDTIRTMRNEQIRTYKDIRKKETEETGELAMSYELLMKRRALRRDLNVRVAINKFWKAIEHWTIEGAWVPKELYYTYNLKMCHVMASEDPDEEEEDDIELLRQMAEEDWQSDLQRKTKTNTKTRRMQLREQRGLPPFPDKPEGVEAISYATFFDSMFEAADSSLGRAGEVDGEKYGELINSLRDKILIENVDENGESSWSWLDDKFVYTGVLKLWGEIKDEEGLQGEPLKEDIDDDEDEDEDDDDLYVTALGRRCWKKSVNLMQKERKNELGVMLLLLAKHEETSGDEEVSKMLKDAWIGVLEAETSGCGLEGAAEKMREVLAGLSKEQRSNLTDEIAAQLEVALPFVRKFKTTISTLNEVTAEGKSFALKVQEQRRRSTVCGLNSLGSGVVEETKEERGLAFRKRTAEYASNLAAQLSKVGAESQATSLDKLATILSSTDSSQQSLDEASAAVRANVNMLHAKGMEAEATNLQRSWASALEATLPEYKPPVEPVPVVMAPAKPLVTLSHSDNIEQKNPNQGTRFRPVEQSPRGMHRSRWQEPLPQGGDRVEDHVPPMHSQRRHVDSSWQQDCEPFLPRRTANNRAPFESVAHGSWRQRPEMRWTPIRKARSFNNARTQNHRTLYQTQLSTPWNQFRGRTGMIHPQLSRPDGMDRNQWCPHPAPPEPPPPRPPPKPHMYRLAAVGPREGWCSVATAMPTAMHPLQSRPTIVRSPTKIKYMQMLLHRGPQFDAAAMRNQGACTSLY